MTNPPSREQARADIRNYLKFLKEAGFLYLVPSGDEPMTSTGERRNQLEALRCEVIKCMKCKLATCRTHVVFGEGNPNADIMFVGEAPGAEEDIQARPFVGRSGKLLDTMMGEVGLKREDIFIGNLIKCRPPGNRNPEADEIESCEPYLLAQIDLIQPKVIVTLGTFATHSLAKVKIPITRMRGQPFLYHNVNLMPTFHPAAVLRQRSRYPEVVGDLRRAVEMVQGVQ